MHAAPAAKEWRADSAHAPQTRPRLAIARPKPPRPTQLNLWADEPKAIPPTKPRQPRTFLDYLPNDELEAAIMRGDREAVTRLLLTLAAKVIAIQHAKRPLPPTLDQEDLVQLAVIDALRRLDKWEPGRASAFSWSTSSVKFSILAEVKKEGRWLAVNAQVPDEDGAFDFADPATLPGIDRGSIDPMPKETSPCGPSSANT